MKRTLIIAALAGAVSGLAIGGVILFLGAADPRDHVALSCIHQDTQAERLFMVRAWPYSYEIEGLYASPIYSNKFSKNSEFTDLERMSWAKVSTPQWILFHVIASNDRGAVRLDRRSLLLEFGKLTYTGWREPTELRQINHIFQCRELSHERFYTEIKEEVEAAQEQLKL